jgi:tripartite-type tricarboxylate transporter receptor subunit TctC
MMDRLHRRLFLSIAAASLGAPARISHASAWPTRPVRLVVPFPKGGGVGLIAGLITPGLGQAFGVPFEIDYLPGEGGNVGTAAVARAAPDGHTLLMCSTGSQAVSRSLYANLPFDPIKDFTAITLVSEEPNALVLHPGSASRLQVTTLADFVRVAPRVAEPLRMASSGVGGSPHLSGELFKSMTDAKFTHVPYAGTGPAKVDLLAGKVDLMFEPVNTSMASIRAGQLVALGVTSSTRSMAMLELPTLAEAGGPLLAGYEATVWFGLVAPAGTPLDIVGRLQSETARILRVDSVRKALLAQGSIPSGMSSSAFARMIQSETHKWARIVKLSGARAS